MRLASIRRAALPMVEESGALQPLTIPTTSGLAEQIHIVFFPKNIVGADFNFYGPRMSRLETYLAARGPSSLGAIKFEPLLRQDVAEQLARLRDIRLFRLKVRATYIATVSKADSSLGRAFEAAAEAGSAEDLEIILSPRAYSRGRLSERLLGTVHRLLRRPDIREESSRFQIRGLNAQTGDIDTIDLLADSLIANKSVMRHSPRGRAVESNSAYAAIEEAYVELRPQLAAALASVHP